MNEIDEIKLHGTFDLYIFNGLLLILTLICVLILHEGL